MSPWNKEKLYADFAEQCVRAAQNESDDNAKETVVGILQSYMSMLSKKSEESLKFVADNFALFLRLGEYLFANSDNEVLAKIMSDARKGG